MKFAPTLKPTFVEHGGWICAVGRCVSYSVLPPGDGRHVPDDTYRDRRPRGALATWHTHGFRSPHNPRDDDLSRDPGGDTDFAEDAGVPNYLIKPLGGALGYDPGRNSDINVPEGDACPCEVTKK